MSTHLSVGLRFTRDQAPRLRELARRAARKELGPEAVDLFINAAAAASKGEPLIVHAANLFEVRLLAAGFTRFGVERPAIEQLSGIK